MNRSLSLTSYATNKGSQRLGVQGRIIVDPLKLSCQVLPRVMEQKIKRVIMEVVVMTAPEVMVIEVGQELPPGDIKPQIPCRKRCPIRSLIPDELWISASLK